MQRMLCEGKVGALKSDIVFTFLLLWGGSKVFPSHEIETNPLKYLNPFKSLISFNIFLFT